MNSIIKFNCDLPLGQVKVFYKGKKYCVQNRPEDGVLEIFKKDLISIDDNNIEKNDKKVVLYVKNDDIIYIENNVTHIIFDSYFDRDVSNVDW